MESIQQKDQRDMIGALKKEQGRELSSFDHTRKEAQAELKRQGTEFINILFLIPLTCQFINRQYAKLARYRHIASLTLRAIYEYNLTVKITGY